jgi:uncharacterized protein YjiS (DUF1127 family)
MIMSTMPTISASGMSPFATPVELSEAQPTQRAGTIAIFTKQLRALVAWRLEQRAIAQLQRLDDRMLHDIGLTRSEIAHVVRFDRLRD